MADFRLLGLRKSFGAFDALKPTDLEVQAGEFIVVVGPSGCGKSTLLRLIAGLDAPDAGRVWVGGRDVTEAPPAERGVAMVFQSYALYPHLTVAENIGFPLRIAKVARREAAARVAKVAALLELGELMDRRPSGLSGGQRQRVAIGRAIVREPRVLLLDEPLSNLDATLRVQMRHAFARLHQELGSTFVYVTHDQVEAMTLAERIVVMNAGRVMQVGAPMDLYARPASREVAVALGAPAINQADVTIVAADPRGATVRLADGGEVRVSAAVAGGEVGRSAVLGVRPEHLRVAGDGPFAGRVELFERLGPLSFAHLGERGGAQTVVAQLPGDRQVVLGERLAFDVAADDAQLFAADGRAYPRLGPHTSPGLNP